MANLGVSPVNFTSDTGKVRVLLGDTVATNVISGVGEYLYFSDDEINAFLEMYGENVKLATARAMETIASSQALLLKSWSSDDLTVNGDRIAESLRKIAAQLREEALADESSEYFNLIAMYVDPTYYLDFAEREREHEDYTWWN
jgi:hypothetical protein